MTIRPNRQPSHGSSVHVAMYPCGQNPYHTLLVNALENRNCKVLKLAGNYDRFPLRLLSEFRGAQVVHFHWIDHLYNARTRVVSYIRTIVFFALLLVLRARGTRIIYTLHNLVPHSTTRPQFHLIVQRLLMAFADTTIVHSQAALQVARETFGERPRFAVIPHGRFDGFYPDQVSKSEARIRLNIPPNAKVALFLGHTGKYKGIQALLQSVEELARRNILLLLAGDTSNLESSARELLSNSSANVLLYEGFVPVPEMQYFTRSADCLVLPYLQSFTSGMAFLGLGFRLPIVATQATAFKEMADSGLCLPCDPGDPVSLAAAIEKACALDRAEFEKKCDAFLKGCEWDKIAEKHLALYGVSKIEPASGELVRQNLMRA